MTATHFTMPDVSDEVLLRGAAHGDERAFRGLYGRHTPAMFGVALRLLARDRADAEDAVQEAWLRAVRGAGRFRGDSTVRTWLVGIAIRCALEIARRRTSPPIAAADATRSAMPANPPLLDLEQAVAALAAGYRHVLILHDLEGYTHAEIAELLGIDEGTSKSQLSRARAIVRRHLMQRKPECSYES